MAYWLDIFTAETWAQAAKFDYQVSGYRPTRRGFARKVEAGDIFICYLGGGISRWVGALEVQSPMYESSEPDIWPNDDFSIRFDTRPIVTLSPETAIPVLDLADKVEMLRRLKNIKQYGHLFQGSPSRIRNDGDGEVILSALQEAKRNPTLRPIPDKILKRGSHFRRATRASRRTRTKVERQQSSLPDATPRGKESEHQEMQYMLLALGSGMGLDVWVANNDKNRGWGGRPFADISRLQTSLPEQFDSHTQSIVELIDVLWLERDGIRCAFEVENTTNIYGGVLRMSDLLARRPNLDIKLYLVAPDSRREKVIEELNRPTFTTLRRPLNKACKFIPYGKLREAVARWGDHAEYLKPDIIENIAEDCRR